MSPISQAKYSALVVYESKDGEYKIFSGSNIDPETKEDLKLPEKRNCAETQAVTAAWREGCIADDVVLMFLYREPELGRLFTAEKLLPCLDCHKKYLSALVSNHGKLVLLLEDHSYKDFLPATFSGKDGNQIQELVYDEEKIHYIVFDAMRMLFLNIEKKLGSRVCEL